MKHNPTALANALATVTAGVYLVCRVLVGLFPGMMFSVAQSWLHGIELSRLNSWNLSLGAFFVGLISSAAFSWLVGYFIAVAYNYFDKK